MFTTSSSVCMQSNNHDQMNAYMQLTMVTGLCMVNYWQIMMATISTILPGVWSFYTFNLVHISVKQHPTRWVLPDTIMCKITPQKGYNNYI